MPVILIAALDRNRVIGAKGGIPWKFPLDMKRFKQLTTGKTVVMGRKTWDSLPPSYRPLPNRVNIVLTRDRHFKPEGASTAASLEDVIGSLPQDEELWVIGGGEIYRQALPLADRLELTHVDLAVEDGDTLFPEVDPDVWEETTREAHDGFAFVSYRKKGHNL